MHSGVYTLFILNFDPNLLARLQMSALRGLEASSIRPQYISFLACGNQLLELAEAIGMDLPTRPLVTGTANLYGHAIHRTVVGTPHRAEDYRRVFGGEPLRGVRDPRKDQENYKTGKNARPTRAAPR
jgi:hypothetical protein